MSGMQQTQVGDVRLAFEVRGHSDSPKMVLLHALGERASNWADIADRFADSFEVFVPDLRGHGDSDWPGDYTFTAMCDDVTGLLDQLELRSVVLVGHSMGGVIAYLVAQQRPELVKRLIIEDVAPPYERDRPIPERPGDTASLDFDWAVVPAIVTEVNAGDPAMLANLKSIAVPTLIIGGGQGSHIPQVKLQEVANRIPECDLSTISAGHHVHSAEPDQFVNIIKDWIHRRASA